MPGWTGTRLFRVAMSICCRRVSWTTLLGISLLLLTVGFSGCLSPDGDGLNDETTNLSTNEEDVQTKPSYVDSQRSWISFINRQHFQKPKKKPDSNKRKRKKNNHLRGPMGAKGPPGPPGPQGPPGGMITKDVMMKEFEQLVREAAEKRAEKALSERYPECIGLDNKTFVMPPATDLDELYVIPRVTAGFLVRLQANVVVSRRTFIELKHFQQPFGGGAFERGSVFDSKTGRFKAPRSGIYQFTANLHVTQPNKKRFKKKLRRKDNVKAHICILSLCQKFASLEYTAGMESNSKVFTVSLTGLLHLQRGQYTSVYIDNSSRWPITIQRGSDFTGILVGL